MADNYLERKMEEYRSGKLVVRHSVKAKASTLQPATGYNAGEIAGKRVLVCGCCLDGIGHELLKFFRSLGCRVAFCDIDSHGGTAVAQDTGSRFYPYDFNDESRLEAVRADLVRRWGGVDISVDIRGNAKF